MRYTKVPKGGHDGPAYHQEQVPHQKKRRFLRSSYRGRGSIKSRICMLIVLFSTISWYYQYNTTLLEATTTERGHNPMTVLHGESAAICAIQKSGLWYIDEWVDYHIALGFQTIFIYDNSDDFEVQEWYSKKFSGGTDLVQIVHWPGLAQQLPAYNDCTKFIQTNQTHSWIAFIDLDEFILIEDMNKYPHIMDLLDTVPQDAGGLAINWRMFHWNNQTRYEPKPLSLRFDHYQLNNNWVKTISRADRIESIPSPHFMIYKDAYKAVDTNGDVVVGPFNEKMPMDVLAINHYHYKSLEEYMMRCKRGRATVEAVQTADTYPPCKPENEIVAEWNKSRAPSYFDDRVWKLLKERVPIYKDKYE